MPYNIIWEENGVVVQFTGIFDFETNVNANCQVWEDPRCTGIRYAIWNASEISESRMTENDFSTLAMQDNIGSLRIPALKMALIAKDKKTRRLFDFYTINYHARLTGWTFMVSDKMETIRNWLSS